MGRPRPIGSRPAAPAARTLNKAGKIHGTCRYCLADVVWLEHSGKGGLAPIDRLPAPGGNVLVHRTVSGQLAGTYSVVAAAEVGLFDATKSVAADATPTLHFNHHATCASSTGRRLARERARGGAGAVLRTVDGDPVHPGAATVGELLSAPPHAVVAHARCTACQGGLDPVFVHAGDTTHPGCDPAFLADAAALGITFRSLP